MSDFSVVGVLAEALAKHVVRETFRARSRETGERATVARCTCGSVVPDFPAHLASVVAALPNIAIIDVSNAKPTAEDQRDDAALAYWPRIQAAIRGAAVGRADMDYLTPECHRKNCKQCGISNPSDLGQAFGQMKHRISETILDELYSGRYSDPDAYYGDEARAAGGQA